MNTLVLNIAPDGTAQCVHTDALPLAELGKLSIRRASKVEFNDATQQWEVRFPDTEEVAFAAKTRGACIEYEVAALNALLAEGQRIPAYEH
jgi:hypothetical protein